MHAEKLSGPASSHQPHIAPKLAIQPPGECRSGKSPRRNRASYETFSSATLSFLSSQSVGLHLRHRRPTNRPRRSAHAAHRSNTRSVPEGVPQRPSTSASHECCLHALGSGPQGSETSSIPTCPRRFQGSPDHISSVAHLDVPPAARRHQGGTLAVARSKKCR